MTSRPAAAQHLRDTEHRLTHDIDVWMASASADGAPSIEPGDANGDREGGPA